MPVGMRGDEDESRFHSRLSLVVGLIAGLAEGFCIPRAPGRTFRSPLTGPLAAGDRPSLCQVMVRTLSDHHAIQYSFIITAAACGVK